jgi:hypothetical protein
MDCEKFDEVVIDALYDELDEVTSAAVRRHIESCARCGATFRGLQEARETAVLPLEEPSDGLEMRILEAAAAAQRTAPWHRRALRGLAWAGSQAMRPQLAAAAVLVLILGSSVLLLRPRPGSPAAGPVRVTERGIPAPDLGDAPMAAAQPAPAATAEAVAAPPMEKARAEAPAGRAAELGPDDKAGAKDEERAKGKKEGAPDAASMLADARALRASSGCSAAVGAFDAVGAQFPGTAAAADAMWEEAECYRSMGDGAKARSLYLALRDNGAYRDRAAARLGSEDAVASGSLNAVAQATTGAGAMPPAKTALAARAAAPAAAPPAPAAKATKRAAAADEPAGGASTPPKAAPVKPSTDKALGY